MTGGASTASAAPAITAAPAAEDDPVTVLSTDFENGTWAPWTQSGGPALAVVDVDGDKALQVSNRVNDYDGIQMPTGLLETGVEYTFTMQARLGEGTAGSANVRFVVKPSYTWVGSTAVTADAWTTVTGTFTAPADVDPAALQAYLGTANLAGPYTYLVDDILVTAPPAERSVTTVASVDFDDSTTGDWTPSGNPTLAYVDADGGKALSITRALDHEGIQSPAGLLEPGVEHTLSMRARLPEGTAGSTQIRFVSKPAFTWIGNTTIDAAGWTTVSATYTPTAADEQIYLGTTQPDPAAPYTVLVDDILITAPSGTGGEEPPPWQPTPDPDFVPGGAVNPTTTPLATARGTGDVAALTFDDGPNPGETDRLLDYLAANDLTATFCVIGQNIQAEGGAAILRRIVADGHTLCNHTTSYADMGSWTEAAVEADLKANLAIIRDALGDPRAQVPYFRAPNGSWGRTPVVAAALGMQPLGLGNVILDWDDPANDRTVEGLATKLRTAIAPGAVVLAHDGGGDRETVVSAVEIVVSERLAEGWTFTLPQGGIPEDVPIIETDFEDGLDGWVPRSAQGTPTVSLSTTEFHGGAQAALVSDRAGQGDGIGHPLTGLITPGVDYDVTAWVKMAAGTRSDDIWLSMQRTVGGADAFETVEQFADVPTSEWRQVTGWFTAQQADAAFLYFETSFDGGTDADFLVDDIVVRPRVAPVVQDVTPLKDTTEFPVGVAIDRRETTGVAGEVVTRHFDQLTPENHMKPEAWYGEGNTLRIHPEATALMDFARAEDLQVYGHVLVWHSQTPAWFFQDAEGQPLTTSAADQEVLRERMRTHIFGVAQTLSDRYGLFGSETNPLVAWDVVNEVVSDSSEPGDGLRRSEWYRILGESYIDLAFELADEAFNRTYAAPGTDRPVTLFINDYNTEQDGKQDRYAALVDRLLARGVPLDGVGHQFHVNLAMPVAALEAAIVRFQDLPVTQVVTELDVTTGTPVTQANLIDQGYYYRDAFRAFREHADELFSVTVWGLTDARSWRSSSGAPLLFDDGLQAKPAFFGAIDSDELPAPILTANVFAGDVPATAGATTSPEWARLPLHPIRDEAGATVGRFQLRWAADHLTAYVAVTDADDEATDAVQLTVDDATYTFGRDGQGAGVQGVAAETTGGWAAVVHLPLTAAQGDTVAFDARVVDGATTSGWNAPGVTGTLTLVEALSFTQAVEAPTAPSIDGEIDPVWATAQSVVTAKAVPGVTPPGGAEATVRTLWNGSMLYVLAEIADPSLDVTGSDPWTQDSFEIFIDPGNLKNGPYLYETSQLRVNVENEVSFGTGDEAFQRGRLASETTVVDGGWLVEASVDLGDEAAGLGTFHGVDFQVNDATSGARTGIKGWADPTGLGYQSSARWGVLELVEAPVVVTPAPKVSVEDDTVRAGTRLHVAVEGFPAGSTVHLDLAKVRGRITTVIDLGQVTVGADGTATHDVLVPRRAPAGTYTLTAASGDLTATGEVKVLPRAAGRP